MCKSNLFETIEISSIIITFKSSYLSLISLLLLLESFGICIAWQLTGIPKDECMVFPSIFEAATPVGANFRTLSEFTLCVFIKCDLPVPAPPVILFIIIIIINLFGKAGH